MLMFVRFIVEIHFIKKQKLFMGGRNCVVKNLSQKFCTYKKALIFAKQWEREGGVETVLILKTIRKYEKE